MNPKLFTYKNFKEQSFQVQLAHMYSERKFAKLGLHTEITPKLDGIRALWFADKSDFLVSRETKPFYYLDHILSEIIKIENLLFLDGELYIENTDFNTIQSIVMNQSPIASKIKIFYYIFIAINKNGKRIENFTSLFTLNYLSPIVLNKNFIDSNILKKYRDKFIEKGYEGVMLRNSFEWYSFGRSDYLLKYKKDRQVEKGKIISFFEGKGKYQNALGGFIVLYNDKKLRIGSGYTDSQRFYLWSIASKLEGKELTFSYQELSEKGVPRFPSFIELLEG